MRKLLAVALWVLAFYEVYLVWSLLGEASMAALKTTALQETINAGGSTTSDQWEFMQRGWIGVGLMFGGVLCVPIIFGLVIWLHKKYKQP